MQIHMNEATPLVSVIMPAYNAAPFLAEAISSVVSQTMANWELFVIDDGSVDDTRKIASDFAQGDSRIQLIVNEVNMGVAKTRNRGIEMARGTVHCFSGQ